MQLCCWGELIVSCLKVTGHIIFLCFMLIAMNMLEGLSSYIFNDKIQGGNDLGLL